MSSAVLDRIEVEVVDEGLRTLARTAIALDPLEGPRRIFDDLPLEAGRRYQLGLRAQALDSEAARGCENGLALGSTPWFVYGETAAEPLVVHLDCADGSSLIDPGMSETRVHHTASWLPAPAPYGRVVLIGGATEWFQVDRPGRSRPLDTLEFFDPRENRFEPSGLRLEQGRAWHQATVLDDGSLIMTGGFGLVTVNSTVRGAPLRQVDRLVSAEDGGSLIPQRSLELGRGAHAAVLLARGQLVLAKGLVEGFDEGGAESLVDSLKTEVYDALGGRSLGITKSSSGRQLKFSPAAVALPDGRRAYLAGGLSLPLVSLPNEVLCAEAPCECGEPPCLEDTDGFGPSMGRLFATATLVPCAAPSDRGAVYVIGGTYQPLFEADAEPRLFSDIYCVDAQDTKARLVRVGRLRKPRAEHTTTLVRGPNGKQRLLVAGGETTSDPAGRLPKAAERAAELLNVVCSCGAIPLSTTVQLKGLHVLHSATLLPDGSVLLAGGAVGGPPERFNPQF